MDKIHFSEENDNIISYFVANRGETNSTERERMKQILSRAIRHELTDRQRDCIIMYYLYEMTMTEVAVNLDLSISTVSRHISAGLRKLRHIASYYSK